MTTVTARSTTEETSLTPMMRQHGDIKAQYPDHIVFFRMGDFYEMFGDDAVRGAEILGITLTKRPHGKNGEIPLAGVPHHQAERYLARLAEAGQRVVVCEQVEDPKLAKGLVKRDVVEIITPGTVMNPAALEETSSPTIAAVSGPDAKGRFGVACAEPSTGRLQVQQFTPDALADFFFDRRIDEILLADDADERLAGLAPNGSVITRRPGWQFETDEAERLLQSHFQVSDPDGVGFAQAGCAAGDPARNAAGALLAYLRETKRSAMGHIKTVEPLLRSQTMAVDRQTAINLDVIPRPQGGRPSLADVLDRGRTAMGRRLVREWLLNPLTDIAAITQRHDAVAFFIDDRATLARVTDTLKGIFDLERFVGRLGSERAGPRDVAALRDCLARWPTLHGLLQSSRLWKQTPVPEVGDTQRWHQELASALVAEPPLGSNDGGIFARGYSEELDALYAGATEARAWIGGLQSRLRAETEIPSLKVGYNKVFAYYIEVPRTHADKVPSDWIRKQTLVSAERFITPELKDKEEIVLRTDERAAALEARLFLELRTRLAGSIPLFADLAAALARIDVLASFAKVALSRGYSRPVLTEDRTLEIRGGRHPVLETINPAGGFVPNDTIFNDTAGWLHLLTGPNMAGKSTYLRQVGLIVLMAQAGSYVSAETATIGVVDRLFTRVGADDDLSHNRSTFMVEMAETARILTGMTPRSLVLFDEVGRGTSTYDGVAIAWAIGEHLAAAPERCPRTLFATHYHELTVLADRHEAIANYQMAIREKGGRVAFLFRVRPGACDDSFGIHVAQMAGVPDPVVGRAREILNALETGTFDPLRSSAKNRLKAKRDAVQPNLFSDAERDVVDRLAQLRTEEMTPIEALNKLDELTRPLRQPEPVPDSE